MPLLAAIALWGMSGWAFFPAQQARLIEIVGVRSAPVALSLNASFIYLGFSHGAALGSFCSFISARSISVSSAQRASWRR